MSFAHLNEYIALRRFAKFKDTNEESQRNRATFGEPMCTAQSILLSDFRFVVVWRTFSGCLAASRVYSSYIILKTRLLAVYDFA